LKKMLQQPSTQSINCPEGATFSGRSLGKSVVPYSLVFCHKKQEIFSASWRLCARHVFGCGYPR
jgi:hypothetical protein